MHTSCCFHFILQLNRSTFASIMQTKDSFLTKNYQPGLLVHLYLSEPSNSRTDFCTNTFLPNYMIHFNNFHWFFVCCLSFYFCVQCSSLEVLFQKELYINSTYSASLHTGKVIHVVDVSFQSALKWVGIWHFNFCTVGSFSCCRDWTCDLFAERF